MKELVFDKNKFESYKNFYEQLYSELDGKNIPDWEDYPNLGYKADNLIEFLWYCHNDNIRFCLKNLDINKIKQQKTIDDYKWTLIIEVLQDFVEKYPNNKLEFIND